MTKRTWQPSKKKRRKHGFLQRMKWHKHIIKRRRAKGRKNLAKTV